MPDETEIRPGGEDHAGDAHGERAGQQSPLQGRAAFIKNWDWQLVASLNRGSCHRGKALHGNNSETHERVRRRWVERRPRELTLGETLDFFLECHRSAPFLFCRACFKIRRGPVFGQKAGWRGATREHTRQRSVTEEQRSQTAFCPKTLRAAGLLPVAGVGSFLTARCGDARNSPPWPRPKSLAAGPLLILKQALCQPDAASSGRREPRALTAKYAKAAVAATAGA